MKTSIYTNLPAVQKTFINQYDGSIESIVNFPDLGKVLNPAYSAHYFYVSGDTMETTITTKHTDGSWAYWGNQTQEEMDNAAILAKELRELLESIELSQGIDIFSIEEMRNIGKVDRVKKMMFVKINGEFVRIKGLKKQ